MKILKQINCIDRLPTKDAWYFVHMQSPAPTIQGSGKYLRWNSETKQWFGVSITEQFDTFDVEYWYDPTVTKLTSEEILPIDNRIKELYSDDNSDIMCLEDWDNKYGNWEEAVYLIDKYHMALEATETELVKYKNN